MNKENSYNKIKDWIFDLRLYVPSIAKQEYTSLVNRTQKELEILEQEFNALSDDDKKLHHAELEHDMRLYMSGTLDTVEFSSKKQKIFYNVKDTIEKRLSQKDLSAAKKTVLKYNAARFNVARIDSFNKEYIELARSNPDSHYKFPKRKSSKELLKTFQSEKIDVGVRITEMVQHWKFKKGYTPLLPISYGVNVLLNTVIGLGGDYPYPFFFAAGAWLVGGLFQLKANTERVLEEKKGGKK